MNQIHSNKNANINMHETIFDLLILINTNLGSDTNCRIDILKFYPGFDLCLIYISKYGEIKSNKRHD